LQLLNIIDEWTLNWDSGGQIDCIYIRPLSRRIPPPPPAGSVLRRRRRKKFGAPPSQPKFMDAAAAVFFSVRRGARC